MINEHIVHIQPEPANLSSALARLETRFRVFPLIKPSKLRLSLRAEHGPAHGKNKQSLDCKPKDKVLLIVHLIDGLERSLPLDTNGFLDRDQLEIVVTNGDGKMIEEIPIDWDSITSAGILEIPIDTDRTAGDYIFTVPEEKLNIMKISPASQFEKAVLSVEPGEIHQLLTNWSTDHKQGFENVSSIDDVKLYRHDKIHLRFQPTDKNGKQVTLKGKLCIKSLNPEVAKVRIDKSSSQVHNQIQVDMSKAFDGFDLYVTGTPQFNSSESSICNFKIYPASKMQVILYFQI